MKHPEPWPALPLFAWDHTLETLHRWAQIVGKIRLALTPSVNHWWQVPLYVTARGLTTSPIPYGEGVFEITFDLLAHNLDIHTSDGRRKSLGLVARPVASFHEELMRLLRGLEIDVHIWRVPVEIADPVPFDEDLGHASYDADWVDRFFRVLLQADRVLKEFEGRFLGKQSPSHFFWGTFDLAQTRYSGRRAPVPPTAGRIERESMSHEQMSFGFWPGTPGIEDAAFYAYAAPEPAGFSSGAVHPPAARYHPKLREFVLPYEAVRRDLRPRERVLEFFQSVYELGAGLAGWDRAAFDRPQGATGAAPAVTSPTGEPRE